MAGRGAEQREFEKLLDQEIILENPLLTGLRGVGKTVLLETFKPLAIQRGWIWVGTDLSESASVSEEALAIRLMADLSVATSALVVGEEESAGFAGERQKINLDFQTLTQIFQGTPGLVEDKLKAVLELAAKAIARDGHRGVVFAYDEAQNLADSQKNNEFHDEARFGLLCRSMGSGHRSTTRITLGNCQSREAGSRVHRSRSRASVEATRQAIHEQSCQPDAGGTLRYGPRL